MPGKGTRRPLAELGEAWCAQRADRHRPLGLEGREGGAGRGNALGEMYCCLLIYREGDQAETRPHAPGRNPGCSLSQDGAWLSQNKGALPP